MMRRALTAIALILILPIASSHGEIHTTNGIITHEILCSQIDELQFDGAKANQSVAYQVGLGPRTPQSNASSLLRTSIAENLSGWQIQNQSHQLAGLQIVNLEATLNAGAGNIVVLMAHYDTRQVSDQEVDVNLSALPVPGANDGASGVAVLLELARHIPTMNLSHEIRLVFTDVEDQGDIVSGGIAIPWASGSQMWTENLTADEIDNISSLVVVDMVGDSDLTLSRTTPGNETLWQAVELLSASLGMVVDQKDCNGDNGSGEMDFNSEPVGVWDDHVHPLLVGIPAIDIIDLKYGSADELSGHWHTQNDSLDKVSEQSLESVGHLLELGLRARVWSEISEPVSHEIENEDLITNDGVEIETKSLDLQSTIVGSLIMFMLFATIAAVACVIFAENEGEL